MAAWPVSDHRREPLPPLPAFAERHRQSVIARCRISHLGTGGAHCCTPAGRTPTTEAGATVLSHHHLDQIKAMLRELTAQDRETLVTLLREPEGCFELP